MSVFLLDNTLKVCRLRFVTADPTPRYLQVTASFEKSCLYEQILLSKDCQESDIISALGTITNVEQTQHVNGSTWHAASITEGTILWQEKDAVVPKCLKRTIEEGKLLLYKIDNTTFRLTNTQNQLDFVITRTKTMKQDCDISLADNEHWAKELSGIVVSVDTSEKILDSLTSENSTTTSSTTMRTAAKPTIPPLLRRISRGLSPDVRGGLAPSDKCARYRPRGPAYGG